MYPFPTEKAPNKIAQPFEKPQDQKIPFLVNEIPEKWKKKGKIRKPFEMCRDADPLSVSSNWRGYEKFIPDAFRQRRRRSLSHD